MESGTFIEQQVPSAVLSHIKFAVLTEETAEKSSVLSVKVASDVSSAKLGLPNEASECLTCGATDIKHCDGHFGYIKLPMDICNPKYIQEMVNILNSVCPACKTGRKKRKIPETPDHQSSSCDYCSGISEKWHPTMKFKAASRIGKMASPILVEVNQKLPKKFQNKKPSEILPANYWKFIEKDQSQEDTCLDSNIRCLTPYQVYHLLKDIDPKYIEKFVPKIECLFLTCLPVTANGNRLMESANRIIFDARTNAYKRLVDFKGQANELGLRVRDCLNYSKLHNENSANTDMKTGSKWIKDVILAKRTDHSFRMVVVGDPKIKFGEIGMPRDICYRLKVSETLNDHNQSKLYSSCKSSLLEMGEFCVRRNGHVVLLRSTEALKTGDSVYRPLDEGDVLLINRPPSIHQHSLIALSVRVLPMESVVSLNPVCCSPLRGDFDGDCVHGYVPQSISSKVELRELVSINHQLINEQNGRNLLSLCHDGLTAAYLLREKGVFFNKFQMQQLGMFCQRELLEPAIVKASPHQNPVWSGKQLFSMLFPPCFDYISPAKSIHISKGEIMCSSLESSWLQDTEENIFSRLIENYGTKALDILFSAQEVLLEWISMRGFSVSLSDLYLSSDSYFRNKLLDEVCCALDEAEDKFQMKQLMVDPVMKNIFRNDECNLNSGLHEVGPPCHLDKKAALSRSSLAAYKEFFRDLQSLVYSYSSYDNALVAMVKAGSKGSLMKLIQQGVSLGLQHSSVPLSFSIPSKTSSRSGFGDHGSYGYPEKNVPYAVVKSSFLDGLDPRECFAHSVSSRSVSFGDNADVPGTIFRNLMFYMRDLYLSYDGTVRSLNGKHVFQFCYGLPEASPRHNSDALAPVGAAAACSISEAAYSALDQPITTLESSPLLNLKMLLESSQKKTAVDRTFSLFLSRKLARWLYGLEYGALMVKSHIERVLFSDVVSTVLIYGGSCLKTGQNEVTNNFSQQEKRGAYMCPWICHFHLCEEEMARRGLSVKSIISVLEQESNSAGDKLKITFPKLHITSRSCLMDDGKEENDGAVCITTTAEASTSHPLLLATLRDLVIPFLLRTVIRGFSEFSNVDILWNELCHPSTFGNVSSGEIYLKVHLSETCKKEKGWNLLMNNCLQIMDLIDWERSSPNNIADVCSVYGIECAKEYLLKKLKVVVSEIGKSILPKHMLLVADCVSVTGEFIGLNAKGIKKHRDMASVSSPFTQACFSSPETCFIKAAKEGAEDYLLGALDAAAWGKEVPLGTGGRFDILYSGKDHEFTQSVDIYDTLSSHCSKGNNVENRVPTACKDVCEKRGVNCILTNGLPSSASDSFMSIEKMQHNLKRILNEYSIDDCLSEKDKPELLKALEYHPRYNQKKGCGIRSIKVGNHPDFQTSRCFFVIRDDGSVEDFSYRKCIDGAVKSLNLPPDDLMREKTASKVRMEY